MTSAPAPSPPGGLQSRLRRGVSWNMLGTLASQGAAFLAGVIVANLLGRDGFGHFSIILSSILTLAGIAQAATGMTATRYIAEYRHSDVLRAGRILRLCASVTWMTGCCLAVMLLLVAPWIAQHVLRAPELSVGLMIGAVAVLFGAVNGFQIGALAGMESYRPLALASIGLGVMHLALCALGTWLGGLNGAAAGLALSALLRWLLFARLLAREAKRAGIAVDARGDGGERDVLWRFALPAAVAGLTALPALWLGQALLARQAGGYTELALYAAAANLRMLVLFVPLIVNNVGMSVLNNQVGAKDGVRYRKVFFAVLTATAITAIGGAALVAAAGPWLLSLFGADFRDGTVVLLILLGSTIVEALAVATYQIMQSHEKMWLSLACINLPRDGLIVGLAWILTPDFGARGLAAAYALAWTLSLIVIALIVFRLGLKVPQKSERGTVQVAS